MTTNTEKLAAVRERLLVLTDIIWDDAAKCSRPLNCDPWLATKEIVAYRQAITLLDEVMATLNSPELVEKLGIATKQALEVIHPTHDGSQTTSDIITDYITVSYKAYGDWTDEEVTSEIDRVYKDICEAAINTIKEAL